MKMFCLTGILMVFMVLTGSELLAQEILVVDPGLGTLNAAIDEHKGNKVYQLKAGQWYQLDGIIENPNFHLQIIGEEPADGQLPATVQTNVDAGGAVFQKMFDAKGDVTLKNIYFMNSDLVGTVGARFITQSKDSARTILRNCIVDPVGFADLIYVTSVRTKTYLYDNLIIRHGHLNHYWDGQIVSHDAGQTIGLDTLIVENNTIVSAGSGLHNSGFAKKVDNYVRWNHNTVVMNKVNLDWSVWDDEYYFTNNLLFNVSTRPTPHSWNTALPGVDVKKPNPPLFMADTVPNETLPSSRTEFIQYNLLYRDSELYDIVDELNSMAANDGKSMMYLKPFMWPEDSVNVSREVSIFSDDESFPNFKYGNSFINVDPQWEDEMIYSYSDSLISWIKNVALSDMGYDTPPASKWADWHWDPDGDPSINNAWPVFNGRYNNPELLTASIEGLPLGDLNWFPQAKAIWEENIGEIESHIHSGNTVKLDYGYTSVKNPAYEIPRVYPNPVSRELRFSGIAEEICLFDISGRVVKKAFNKDSISVTDLHSGIYFLSLKNRGIQSTHKIVVKK